jgi:hypothetical protein
MLTTWRKLLAIVAALYVIGIAAVSAQENTINIGDTVAGRIVSAGDRIEYRLTAQTGDVILISMTSNNFDTYIYLNNARGEEIASNDDGGDGTNSLITGFEIQDSGDYVLIAASYADSSVGEYTLTVARQQINPIEYGQTIEGQLSLDVPAGLYRFRAQAGDLISAYLSSQDFNGYMELIGPSGFTIGTSNYVSPESVRLGPVDVTTSGDYTLNVRTTDRFTLTLDNVFPPVIGLNQPATETFSSTTNAVYFAYEGASGQIVDFSVSGGLGLRIELIAPPGNNLNADSAESSIDPSIRTVLLDQDGVYYIILSPSTPDASLAGAATLTVTESDLPSLDQGPVDVAFDLDTNERILSFEGRAGDTVRITVIVDQMEGYSSPYIEFRQGNEVIATVNQTGMRRLSFDFDIPEDGMVAVFVEVHTTAQLNITLGRPAE